MRGDRHERGVAVGVPELRNAFCDVPGDLAGRRRTADVGEAVGDHPGGFTMIVEQHGAPLGQGRLPLCDSQRPQGCAVDDRHVRAVAEDHRMVRRGLVEFGLAGKPLLGELVLRCRDAGDKNPVALLGLLDAIAQLVQGGGHRGGAGEAGIDPVILHPQRLDRVAVRVDQTGNHASPVEVDHLGGIPAMLADVVIAPDGDEPAVSNRHRFGLRPARIQRSDDAVDEDQVGCTV